MKRSKPGFRQELLILFYAVRHPQAPWIPRLVALLALGYLLSPVDLIPDFIPFAGWIDDLVLVPLLLHFSFRLMPPAVLQASRLKAAGQRRRFRWVLLALLLLVVAGFWYLYARR